MSRFRAFRTVAAGPARVLAATAAAIVGALALPVPAVAHGADAPDATDYRTRVSRVTPALPGLTVRAIEAGARLELANRTGRTIEVLGYHNEPYLEVRPDGVYENTRSPATYLNRTLDGGIEPPPTADATLPPSWRRATTEPVARWHDHRTHWMSATPPADVRADPTRTHRVRDWVVPLRDGASVIEVRGTLDWLPPPNPGAWWGFALLGAVVVGALGLLPGRGATRALAALGAVGGLTAVVFAVAREVDAGASGVGDTVAGLLLGQLWPVLTGLGAVAAAGYALARRPASDFAFALSGACLALFAGAANAGVFAGAVPPVAWPPIGARLAITAVIATGGGLAAAGALRLRAAARSTTAGTPAVPLPEAAEQS